MSPETILLILILLACPVGMLLLHRGGHHGHHRSGGRLSLTELRRMRARLDREIAARKAPAAPAHREGRDARG